MPSPRRYLTALQLCSNKAIVGSFERIAGSETQNTRSEPPPIEIPEHVVSLLGHTQLRQIGNLMSREYPSGANLTDTDLTPEKVIRSCVELLQSASQGPDLAEAIAVAVPLPVTTRGHRVLVPWLDQAGRLQSMQEALQEALRGSRMQGAKIVILNRAHAGAWAEYHYRKLAGEPARRLAYVDVGAGIGVGLIADKQLVRGVQGFAGLYGHAGRERPPAEAVGRDGRDDKQRCEICRQLDCDALCASGRYMAWAARRSLSGPGGLALTTRVASRREQDLALLDTGYVLRLNERDQTYNGGTPQITSLAVIDAAEDLDGGHLAVPREDRDTQTPRTIVQQAGAALGRIVAQVLWADNPSLITLGGLATASNVLLHMAKKTVDDVVLDEVICPIEWAEIGPMAPLYGSAMYVAEQVRSELQANPVTTNGTVGSM